MQIVSFFIDGYNLYHSLKDYKKNCRWLNLKSLCEKFLKNNEVVGQIYYFTAYATWNKNKTDKHKLYVKVLMKEGVEPVFGKLKPITRLCQKCGQRYNTHEEKQSDVNIAMYLFEDAMKDSFDKAIIISGDSDLVQPIKKIQSNFPTKKIGVITPYCRSAKELKDIADFSSKITAKNLEESLFSGIIVMEDGTKIHAPAKWLPNK